MRVKLKVLNGKSAGREVKVPDTGFLIGRSQECHLRPKSDAISRQHCEIVIDDGKLLIRDMGSKNGTYVNGKRIDGQVQLTQGDQLLVGKLELEVIIDVPAPAPVAPPATSNAGGAANSSTGTDTDSGTTDGKEDSWALDDDISTWLDDGESSGGGSGDPDTRQFKLDELQQTVSDESTLNAMKDASMEETTSSDNDNKKKEPGKLPSRHADSDDSKAAADDILKRFFNRP
jgi:predicted component of type VI protein secretion system